MVGGFRLRANQVAYWCWCLMLFFISFSTALGLLMSALAVGSGLMGFTLESFKKAFRQPVIVLCVLLFGWLTLSMLWSIAPRAEMLEAWSKYRKLLYPLLSIMVLYNLRKSPAGLMYGFMAGTGLCAFFSFSSYSGVLEYFLGPPEVMGGWYIGPNWLHIGGPSNPVFGRNHITQSAFLVMSAMLALGMTWSAYHRKKSAKIILGWSGAVVFYLYPVFLLQGRTGYLLAIVLATYCVLIMLRYLPKKHVIVGLGVGTLLMGLVFMSSQHFSSRTKVMTDSVQRYLNTGVVTDSAIRLIFWTSGLRIFLDAPIIGVGVGGYAEAFSRLESSPKLLSKSRVQPHSEFILMLVQGGAVAFLLFLSVIINCVLATRVSALKEPYLLGILILYFVDGLINSVVWDLAEGHILIMVLVLTIVRQDSLEKSGRDKGPYANKNSG